MCGVLLCFVRNGIGEEVFKLESSVGPGLIRTALPVLGMCFNLFPPRSLNDTCSTYCTSLPLTSIPRMTHRLCGIIKRRPTITVVLFFELL